MTGCEHASWLKKTANVCKFKMINEQHIMLSIHRQVCGTSSFPLSCKVLLEKRPSPIRKLFRGVFRGGKNLHKVLMLETLRLLTANQNNYKCFFVT